jgi:hypothetical protein
MSKIKEEWPWIKEKLRKNARPACACLHGNPGVIHEFGVLSDFKF